MLKQIGHELRHHAPFTLAGAVIGILLMVALFSVYKPGEAHEADHEHDGEHVEEARHEHEGEHEHHHELSGIAGIAFEAAHTAHVFLSAMVTAGLYRLKTRKSWWYAVPIGVVGAIGIATLSDSLIPYLGEVLHDLPDPHLHAGFIESWHLVFPAAIAGSVVVLAWPNTTFPHAGHVLLSTAASLAHMMMSLDGPVGFWLALQLGVFLFLAVWVPCCTSDIVFPLLFAGKEGLKEHVYRHEDADGEGADDKTLA